MKRNQRLTSNTTMPCKPLSPMLHDKLEFIDYKERQSRMKHQMRMRNNVTAPVPKPEQQFA